MPKPRYENRQEEFGFYQAIFQQAEERAWDTQVLKQAQKLAEQYGLSAMDAVHVAHAMDAGADELVTTEKPTKPLFRVKADIAVRSLHPDAA